MEREVIIHAGYTDNQTDRIKSVAIKTVKASKPTRAFVIAKQEESTMPAFIVKHTPIYQGHMLDAAMKDLKTLHMKYGDLDSLSPIMYGIRKGLRRYCTAKRS